MLAATFAAVAPILVGLVRALARGWYPLGDNAFFALRARDVGTEHHPWLGTWSSASLSGGDDINNPGPLLFNLLAIPAKLDHVNGVAVGSALLNVAAVVGLVLAARRRGPGAAAVAAAGAAGLVWAMGSELLIEPWQPHSLLLPFLAYLVLIWGIAAGDAALLPWAAGVGSLLVQTHLSYVILVPLLAGAALVGVVLAVRRGEPLRWRRPVLVAVLVAGLAWAQPVVDQVAGEGNLGALLAAVTDPEGDEPVGPATGARLMATVVASPPLWARPSFEESFVPVELQPPGPPSPQRRLVGVPSTGGAVAGLAVLVAVLGVAGALAARRRDVSSTALVAGAAVALAAGFLTAAMLPVGPLGLGPHQLRWLWPLSVFATMAVSLGAAGGRRLLVPAATAGALGLGTLALPTHAPAVGPTADAHAIGVLRQLAPQLDAIAAGDRGDAGDAVLPGRTLLVEVDHLRLFEPWTTPVMLELSVRGVELRVDHRFTLRQVGTSRRATGDEDGRVFVLEGPAALREQPDAQRVALVSGLDGTERAELDRLGRQVRGIVERDGLELTDDGRRALEVGLLPVLGAADDPRRPDPGPLIDSGELAMMVRRGWVELAPDDRAVAARWAELRLRWHRDTVGVFIAPLE